MRAKLCYVVTALAGTLLLSDASGETIDGMKGAHLPEGSVAKSRQAILETGISEEYLESHISVNDGDSDCGPDGCAGWTTATVIWDHRLLGWEGALGSVPPTVAITVSLVPDATGLPSVALVEPAGLRELSPLPSEKVMAALDVCGPRAYDSDTIGYCPGTQHGDVCVDREVHVGAVWKNISVDVETGIGGCETADTSAEPTGTKSSETSLDEDDSDRDPGSAGCSVTRIADDVAGTGVTLLLFVSLLVHSMRAARDRAG